MIGLVRLIICLKNDRNGCGFAPEWAWLLKVSRVLLAQELIRTPLLEILDLPLLNQGTGAAKGSSVWGGGQSDTLIILVRHTVY